MKNMTLTTSYLQQSLKQARYYEFCKDCDRALTVLRPIWNNIEEPPNIAQLNDREAWELLLVCGSVISAYGTTHQKKHYKELAVDMLTRARELGISIGERDLIAEAEKQMAIAYWRHGELENAVAFLNTVLGKYSEAEQLTNSICLYAQANLLILYYQVDRISFAFDLYKKIKPFVDESDDLWLKTGFYNQAAGIFVLAGQYKIAIPLLEKDAKYAALTKNYSYLGNALNNLANAYIHLKESKKAMNYVNQAIDLFLSINQIFSYALALETKSLIHSNNGDYKKALVTIDESIKILEQGENYGELCESLWRRTEILIKTCEKKQAIRQFTSLLQIANDRLDLLTGDEYIEKFNQLVYLPTGGNLEEMEKNFRRFLLDNALKSCGGIVTTTANYLGVMHQTLSAMLKKFPILVEKHQVKLRTRTVASSLKPKSPTGTSFAIRLSTDRLAPLGLLRGMIVEISRCPLEKLDLSKPIVIQDIKKNYHCGFLVNAFEMLVFEDGRGNIERAFVLEEIIDAGQVVRVFDEKSGKYTTFD